MLRNCLQHWKVEWFIEYVSQQVDMAAEYIFVWNIIAPQHVYQAFTRYDAALGFH